MRRPTRKATPEQQPHELPHLLAVKGPDPNALPWHRGRTFYACPCSAQDEHKGDNPPEVLDCWSCHRPGAMRQWLPPAVKRDREAGRV